MAGPARAPAAGASHRGDRLADDAPAPPGEPGDPQDAPPEDPFVDPAHPPGIVDVDAPSHAPGRPHRTRRLMRLTLLLAALTMTLISAGALDRVVELRELGNLDRLRELRDSALGNDPAGRGDDPFRAGSAGLPPPGWLPAEESKLAPEHGALFGAWAGSRRAPEGNLNSREVGIRNLEARLGRPLDIVHNFYAWDDPFPLKQERRVLRQGKIPLISWNGTDTAAIVRGALDDEIAAHADAVRALPGRVLLRWFWEMEGEKKADEAGPPKRYIAAWRHVREVFAERGATDVEWVWCPTAFGFSTGEAQAYYPGDQFVDWVCADGYDFGPSPDIDGNSGGGARPFAQIFRDFYAWARLVGKPVILAEFGVEADSLIGQGAWLRSARDVLPTGFPLVKAIVYFDSISEIGNDWRVRSPDAVAALRELASDPYFSPRRDAPGRGNPEAEEGQPNGG